MPPEDNPADDVPPTKEEYDPWADLISANQEEIARVKAGENKRAILRPAPLNAIGPIGQLAINYAAMDKKPGWSPT